MHKGLSLKYLILLNKIQFIQEVIFLNLINTNISINLK